jgi:hypothetical protein
VSILAHQTMAHRRALLQQHWVLERSSWHASLGQTLSRSLESTQTLLELCAGEVRRLRDRPEEIPVFLLGVLKTHPDVLQLSIPAAPDAAERRAGFAPGAIRPAGPGPDVRWSRMPRAPGPWCWTGRRRDGGARRTGARAEDPRRSWSRP